MIYGKGKRPKNRLSSPPVRAVKRGRGESVLRAWLPFIGLLSAAVCALTLLFFKASLPATTQASPVAWAEVLLKKRSWTEAKARKDPNADALRQAWADAVEDFSEANPQHLNARQAHEALVLEQARDLARAARYEESRRLYEALMARRPNEPSIRSEYAAVLERQNLTREELANVRAGFGKAEVERLIGAPQPGWTRTAGDVEGWYYSRGEGGVAAVFFRDGKVFAVDYDGGGTPRPAGFQGQSAPDRPRSPSNAR